MKYIKSFFIVLILMVSNGCSEDILELSPLDSVSEAVVWNDLNLIELYVNDRYDELPHGFVSWSGELRMASITDESYHQWEAYILDKHTRGGLTPTNMLFFGGYWLDAYTAIRNQNLFLEKIANYQGNEVERVAQLTAEIRFLRAWFHLGLATRYGAIPLATQTFKIDGNLDLPRTSFPEIIDFVVSELDEIIDDLPSNAEVTGADFGRVTKGAGLGLKIRALMFNASPLFDETGNGQDASKWQLVADACEDLFDLNQYSLSSDYKDIFNNAKNPEVIFAKQFIGQFGTTQWYGIDGFSHWRGGHDMNRWQSPSGVDFLGWTSENPRQGFVDQYETLSGHIPVLGYTLGSYDDELEANLAIPIYNPEARDFNPDNPYQNRDPRFEYSVQFDGQFYKTRELEFWFGGLDSRDPINNPDGYWNGPRIGYGTKKFLQETWSPQSTAGSFQPWIYMRLAEFYLTYAEAQYHIGGAGIAVDYINLVRSRPGVEMPSVDASGDLLEKIKHERKIELAFESNRYFDAKRWLDAEEDFGKDVIGVRVDKVPNSNNKSYKYYYFDQIGTRSFPKSHYFWPIPNYEIVKTNLQQNPGY
ncbi:RagB/SusD family nutrient uptake outer membrane protein [Polaribacter litorisediminis]|uniref:RagB/SusD family nutrient uptake outer membrane protein n=1 Tax=Polaribacter litorisediminis TaxID=1908341 RepID=UPI001CC0D27C|nr:RagB/SusD family nutrient uptake outer membrane protein [Polaribacter litorisediminis]UAM97992.1 RagB/SusD family nutrient uptake outer membrane protein [Polaribacter litorisediminis]